MKICEENQVTGVMVTTMDEVLLSDRIVMFHEWARIKDWSDSEVDIPDPGSACRW